MAWGGLTAEIGEQLFDADTQLIGYFFHRPWFGNTRAQYPRADTLRAYRESSGEIDLGNASL
jgi:hypothetical protein